MVRSIIVLGGLLVGAVALADKPPADPLVEDLLQLRQSLAEETRWNGPALATDDEQFAEAAQRQATGWDGNNSRPHAPTNRSFSGRSPHVRPESWQPFEENHAQGPSMPSPQMPGPPQHLLPESAFELERIAHRLEMAELYDAADAVRKAADQLRRAGRNEKDQPYGKEKEGGSSASGRRGSRDRAERFLTKPRIRSQQQGHTETTGLRGYDQYGGSLQPSQGVHGGPHEDHADYPATDPREK